MEVSASSIAFSPSIQPLQPAFEAFQKAGGQRPDTPAITVAFVSGLARPVLLVEMDAVAVVLE